MISYFRLIERRDDLGKATRKRYGAESKAKVDGTTNSGSSTDKGGAARYACAAEERPRPRTGVGGG